MSRIFYATQVIRKTQNGSRLFLSSLIRLNHAVLSPGSGKKRIWKIYICKKKEEEEEAYGSLWLKLSLTWNIYVNKYYTNKHISPDGKLLF